ncbi:GNAT family N-acetyltransferase [Planktomarina sp.]|nr:GNAT family N-acetyltransferase [Planktomarina sp.]
MFGLPRKLTIETERLILRPPHHNDFHNWVQLRSDSRDFLSPWDPVWSDEHLTRKNFTNRVYWAQRAIKNGNGCPLFLIRKTDQALIGAITLDNIRRGPAQAGTLGYWTGQAFARQGFMREAVECVVLHAFLKLDLSRVEAACLPENQPSRGLLESCRFKYEGVAQSYLQIAGRWRTHVLYAAIRHDRRGKTEAG